MLPIHTHKELAAKVAGKKILHLNSLGKDAILTLEWLVSYAKTEVVSLYLTFESSHPGDEPYLRYLKKRYPHVRFIATQGTDEMNEILGSGMFQSPLYMNYVANNQEFAGFNKSKIIEEIRIQNQCDYIASGISCYETMGRALYLKKNGLLSEKKKEIYPIGLMKKKQVIQAIVGSGIRLHPCYRYSTDSYDTASWYKMRLGCIADQKFYEKVLKKFPLLALDRYRYEVLFEK